MPKDAGEPPLCDVCGLQPREPRYREGRDGREPHVRPGKWRRRCAACRQAGRGTQEGTTNVGLVTGRYSLDELVAATGLASIVALSRATSDPDDLRRLDPDIGLTTLCAARTHPPWRPIRP